MKTDKKDFIKVPWIFWQSVASKMDYIEGYIFLLLAQYCYGNKTDCYPTQKTISRHTGIPLITVKRKIEAMVARGVIEIIDTKREGKPKWNTYRLTEWNQIQHCEDWYDVQKTKQSRKTSNDTFVGITAIPANVSQRDINKINRIRLIEEDKLVADATIVSDSSTTTVSSGNRGEAPRLLSDVSDTIDFLPRGVPASLTSDLSHEASVTTKTTDSMAQGCEKVSAEDRERERRRRLTIAQLIEEDVNPRLEPLPSSSDESAILDAIWHHFRCKGESFKYKRALYAMKLTNSKTEDPVNAEVLSEKEALIRATSMLERYWEPDYWYGDGSLIMFISNYKKFYSDITIMRWRRLEDYCNEHAHPLALKCIREKKLFSLKRDAEMVSSILSSGIRLTDNQRGYLSSDPATLKYNCVGALMSNHCFIREEDQHEISIETMIKLYDAIGAK